MNHHCTFETNKALYVLYYVSIKMKRNLWFRAQDLGYTLINNKIAYKPSRKIKLKTSGRKRNPICGAKFLLLPNLKNGSEK